MADISEPIEIGPSEHPVEGKPTPKPHLTRVPHTGEVLPRSLYQAPQEPIVEDPIFSDEEFKKIEAQLKADWETTYPHFYAREDNNDGRAGSFTLRQDALRNFRRAFPERYGKYTQGQ